MIERSRKPLKMLEHGIINSSNLHGINKFGLPVVFVNKKQIKNSKYHISIGDWTAVNGELRVQLFYPIEGIIINYMFEKVNGQWEIKDFIIVEE